LLEGLQWYTSGLSDPHSSLHQVADRDFANACRTAFLRRVVAFLRRDRRSDELLSFEQVRRELPRSCSCTSWPSERYTAAWRSDRSGRAAARDRGRVGPVVKAETDNNADVADQR